MQDVISEVVNGEDGDLRRATEATESAEDDGERWE